MSDENKKSESSITIASKNCIVACTKTIKDLNQQFINLQTEIEKEKNDYAAKLMKSTGWKILDHLFLPSTKEEALKEYSHFGDNLKFRTILNKISKVNLILKMSQYSEKINLIESDFELIEKYLPNPQINNYRE